MKMVRCLAAAALASALLLSPAGAADGPTGIAISASPEAGSGVCFEGADPAAGFDCAARKCAEASGAQGDQCAPVAWCLPSLFAADMVVNTAEGFTYHQYFCGVQDQAELVSLARAKCAGASDAGANACTVAAAWNPDGEEITITDEMLSPEE